MNHKVMVTVEGQEIDRWLDYSIENDMLAPADDFSMSIGPASRELFDLLSPDSAIEVAIDSTAVLSGFIGQRTRHKSRSEGSVIRISGRDRGGRLTDESMPLQSLRGLTLEHLAQRVAGPWFKRVTFSNAANRDAVRGRAAGKASARRDPASHSDAAIKKAQLARYATQSLGGLFERGDAPRKVEPGQTRWGVLSDALEPARFLAWSTADGRELVVGVPNYDQAPQFQFFLPADSQSARRGFANVISWDHVSSSEDRYAEVTVVGRRGKATAKGDGFKHPKTLLVGDDDARTQADTLARAHRELALRDKTAETIQLVVDGHSQRFNRSSAEALFAFDTVAEVLDEEVGVSGRWYITAVNFTGSRDGQQTELTLIPVGTELAP